MSGLLSTLLGVTDTGKNKRTTGGAAQSLHPVVPDGHQRKSRGLFDGDGLDRAGFDAGATADAVVGFDDGFVVFNFDRLDRAFFFAGTAAHAFVLINNSGHDSPHLQV